MTAESLMLWGGLSVFLWTLWWVRKRILLEKYAVMWLAVAGLVLTAGLFPELLMTFANRSHLSYPAAALFLALGGMYVYSFGVSLSLSKQYRRGIRLAQEVALLEQRLRALEMEMGHPGPRAHKPQVKRVGDVSRRLSPSAPLSQEKR